MEWTSESEEAGGRFAWEEEDGGIRILDYEGDASLVKIPPEIGGKPVRTIGRHTFYNNGLSVKRIEVPPTVRTIEDEAFEFAICLTDLILSEGVEVLGRGFISATQVAVLPVPASVKKIRGAGELEAVLRIDPGNGSFQTDHYGLYQDGFLLAVNPSDPRESYRILPDTLGIRSHAFMRAGKLRSLSLPFGCDAIGEGAFWVQRDSSNAISGAERLLREEDSLLIQVDRDDPSLFIRDGLLLKRNEGGGSMVLAPEAGKIRTVSLSSDIRSIAGEAFRDTGLEEVYLPLSLEGRIGRKAFSGCPLRLAVLEEEEGETRIRFPYEHTTLMEDLMEGFGLHGRRYDFTAYDRAILEGSWIPEKVHMALSRLKTKKHLRADEEKKIREKLSGRMGEVMDLILSTRDGEALTGLSREDLLTEEMVDGAIEKAGREGAGELLPILMEARHKIPSGDWFDFSL